MNVDCLVILHRHGARFPGYKTKDNLCYPSSDKFWEDHNMMLTPTGSRQLYKLGKEMKSYYPIMSLHKPEVFSSYTTRTVMSSLAFLDGAYPEASRYITHDGDRCETDYCQSDGIRIHIEEKKQYDTLFHMGPSVKKLMDWRRRNIVSSPLIAEVLREKSTLHLLDKLYIMSGSERIAPSLSLTERLSRITEFNTLLRSSECSNLPLLPNKYGLTLTDDEIEDIKSLSSLIYSHHFSSWNKKTSDETGSSLCGHLLSSVSSFLASEKGVRIYSAHDTTLLAVSASLGWEVPMPNFSAYYVFERVGNLINIRYCPEPSKMSLRSLPSLKWIKRDNIVPHLSDFGESKLSLFIDRYLHPQYEIMKKKLTQISSIGYVYSKDNVCTLETDSSSRVLFDYFDGDRDGLLSESEFAKVFKRYGIVISNERVRNLLRTISSTMTLTERQFICLLSE